ncbi:MAG: SurA N-terminal domain-containing protein [Armatimonadota bacterium]
MKTFFKDWRNTALIIAVVVIILMLAWPLLAGSGDRSPKIAKVGNDSITEQMLVKEMKRQIGDQTLVTMISEKLMEQFAAKKGVTINDGEINGYVQYQRLLMEMQGESLDDMLKAQGLTMDEIRDNVRRIGIQVKLIVPNGMIEKEIVKSEKQLSLPAYYRIRELYFESEADAKKGIEMMKKGEEGLTQALSLAKNGQDALKIRLYAPGVMGPSEDKKVSALLKNMKSGQCSPPLVMPNSVMPEARRVIQVVEAVPPLKPTFENSLIIVGQQLMRTDKDLQVVARGIQGEALQAVSASFYGSAADYPKAYKIFEDARLNNPVLPSADSPTDIQLPPMGSEKGKSPVPAPGNTKPSGQ